jgi:hypothetical protein
MKKSKNNNICFILLIACFAFYMSACKKKKDAVTPTTPTGTLMFHLHTNVDTNEVDNYNTVYTLRGGRKISVSKAQLYISNIQLIKLDGTTYSVPNTIIYKVQEAEVYLIGQVPVGNYKSISFEVGLDPTTSLKTPTATDSALNQPSMWFGSAAQPQGYTYVNFQGSIDTTTAGNSSTLIPFKYLIGTNSNAKQVTMPVENYSVTQGQTQFVHLIIDYNMLFNGIKLNNSNNLTVASVADNATVFGTTISNNIVSMFRYEQ